MASKYHVHVSPLSPRFEPVPKYCSLEVEGCLGCLVCAKRTACVYDVYRKRRFEPGSALDTADNLCVGCFSCVQECKKGILSRIKNPAFAKLGDAYWTPELVANIWRQAATGNIPVSGAGYRGPFTGPGFDRMWTDMSEIVRPTRDGIHGREYISTVVELGRKPRGLSFDEKGDLLTEPTPFIEAAIPLVLDRPPFGLLSPAVNQAIVRAAKDLQTSAVVRWDELGLCPRESRDRLMVQIDPQTADLASLDGIAIVEMAYSDKVADHLLALKKKRPGLIAAVRLDLDEDAAGRAVDLGRAGVDVLHLRADDHGQGRGRRKDKFVIDLVREVHLALVSNSLREEVTLIAGGGVALAEHVAKIIICGADLASLDLSLLAALECRLCPTCQALSCPVAMDRITPEWGSQRIVNLVGSWHSQLIEVMGAMGLREIRRMRGEVGRAMFFEDLERESFAPIFGKRRDKSVSSGNPGWDAAQRPVLPLDEARPKPPEEPSPSRYRNQLGKYKVVRTSACLACGQCAETCSFGVHVKAGKRMLAPRSFLCRGEDFCRAKGAFCGETCPQKAVQVGRDPLWETVGDPRWTADLIAATWVQAETGRPPRGLGLEYRTGASGGGFDRMDFRFPAEPPDGSFSPEEVDLGLELNRSNDNRPRIRIGLPVYGGGMSFGSISLSTMTSRARAYKAFGSFTCTGEGGYPDALVPYDDNVITQVATGLFGVREETIQRVRIVEFKYAQGAKPGLGGHLLGDKVTPAVARMREAVEGNALFSPFPFHSVYSVEDHKKHVDWIKAVNPKALVSVKVSTPTDVDMVAVGSFYAGAHIIHIDGSYGGTGAAPDIAKKNIAMPIEYAIPKVHNFLVQEGVRDRITLVASGGLRTAWDIAKAIALGADGVVVGTAELVALECIRCANCESGRGCPRGIATTDPELSVMFDDEWGSRRIINLFTAWCLELKEILWRLGLRSIRDLVGRSDLLIHWDYES